MQFLSLPTASSPTHLLPPKPFFKSLASSSASFRGPSQPPPPPPKPSPPPPPPLPSSNPLASKLWLSSRLSPPPHPPPPPPEMLHQPPPPKPKPEPEAPPREDEEDFRQKGRSSLGTSRCGRRGRRSLSSSVSSAPSTRSSSCAATTTPSAASDSASSTTRARPPRPRVDGVDFRGRSFTVRLDYGRKGKARAEERARWVDHGERRREARSPWHQGWEEACREFRRVVESRPEDCLQGENLV